MNASLPEIVDAIGLPAALELVRAFGGVRIYLPHPDNIAADNPVARVIGVEAARKLSALWPQERPYLPRAIDYLRRQRNQQLRQDYRTISASQVALKYQLTERQVYEIVSTDDAPIAAAQPELF